MTGHELKPGDAVRFTSTGQIGVVAKVTDGAAHVWMLEWVGRNPPLLIKRMCALESLTWESPTNRGRGHEMAPASVPMDWRNRLNAAWNAINGR